MPTITKSVTLQPGEQFTLPPGATLIGSSSSQDVTSSCEQTIPQLNYTQVILAWDVPQPSNNETFGRTSWIGVKIGPTYYSFQTAVSWSSAGLIQDQLNNLSISVPFINNAAVAGFDGDAWDGGLRYVVRVNVLDTYKDDFYAVRVNNVNGNIGTGDGLAVSTAYVKFKEDPNSIL